MPYNHKLIAGLAAGPEEALAPFADYEHPTYKEWPYKLTPLQLARRISELRTPAEIARILAMVPANWLAEVVHHAKHGMAEDLSKLAPTARAAAVEAQAPEDWRRDLTIWAASFAKARRLRDELGIK